MFVAICGEKVESSLETAEVLDLCEMPFEEFEDRIATGQIQHAAGIAAWARYALRKPKEIINRIILKKEGNACF